MRTRILLWMTVGVVWPSITIAAQLTIDDFTTGPKVSFLFSGTDSGIQAGSMVGGFRRTNFLVAPFPVVHPGLLQIRSGGPLIVSCGYKVAHRLDIGYGLDGNGGNVPLNLDLSAYNRLVVDFDASDAGLNFNIVLFWASGAFYAIQGFNLGASNVPFSVNFPFADFIPGVPSVPLDVSDIDYIAVIAQTGTPIGSNDYAITSIKAVGP
jgi:hypothetical protein